MARSLSITLQLALTAAIAAGGVGLWRSQDAALGLFADAGVSSRPGASDRARPGVPVIVAPVGTEADDVALEVVGTGRARRSIMLRAEDTGRVVEMNLEPGRAFEAGDVLMRLEDDRQRLALALAETRLAEAERVRDRLGRLQDSGAATEARLDEVRTAAEIARLEVEQARRALEDRVLRAPFAGVSGLPAVEVGARVGEDFDIASYDDRSVLLVEFDLPESAIPRVSEGLTVEARTAAAPGRVFEGEVVAIDSRVDAASRTARVRVAIPNGEDALRPGGAFAVRLDLPGPRLPTVPELALQFERGGLHVWRVVDGVSEKAPVTLVRRRAGRVLVEGPLQAGDQVVVEGTQRLDSGRAVDVVGTRDAEGQGG